MDQDATWYGGRPRPWPHCVRWGPSPLSPRDIAPNFRPVSVVAKRLDGRTVDLGPDDVVLDGDPACPQRDTAPQFLAHVCCGQTAGWIKMPRGTEVDFGPGHIVLDADLAPR